MVAGNSCQLVFVLQSLIQLKTHYGDGWENFLGQCCAWALIGPPADKFTADYLSERSGEMTIKQPNVGMNFNPGGTMGLSTGEGYTKRPYLMPQDLNNIPVGSGLGYVWAAGLSNPIPAYFPPYWDVETLNARARRNPFYKG